MPTDAEEERADVLRSKRTATRYQILVEVAEREGFDRIVLGGGETSPLGKVKLGSIAEFVILNAGVSVTLIR